MRFHERVTFLLSKGSPTALDAQDDDNVLDFSQIPGTHSWAQAGE